MVIEGWNMVKAWRVKISGKIESDKKLFKKKRKDRERGFVLKQLVVVTALALGIFSLLQVHLRSYAQRENLESEEWKREALLDSVGEVFFYEMALLNSYVLEGKLMSIEEYFSVGENGEPVYLDYDNVAKFHMRTKDLAPGEKIEISPDELMSVGGYQINYLNPKFSLWPEGRSVSVTFRFAKIIEVVLGMEIGEELMNEWGKLEGGSHESEKEILKESGEGEEPEKNILRVKIETGLLKSRCTMTRADKKVSCDPLPKVEELIASED